MYRHALRHGDMATVSSTTRISHAFSAFQSSDNEAPPKWFHEDRSGQVFGCLCVFALWHIVTYCDGTAAVKFIQEIWTKSRYFMLFHLIFESAKWSKCWSILSSFVDVKKSCWRKKTGAAALEQQIFLPRDHGLRGHPIRCGRPKFPTAPTPHEFSTRSPKYVSSSLFFSVFFHVIPFFLCLSINKTVRKHKKTMIHKSSLEGTCVQIVNKEIFTKKWFSCIFSIICHTFLTFGSVARADGVVPDIPGPLRQDAGSHVRVPELWKTEFWKFWNGETLENRSEKVEKQNTKQFFLRNEIDGMCQNGYVVNSLNWYELICVCIRVVLCFGLHGLHGKTVLNSATKCALRCRGVPFWKSLFVFFCFQKCVPCWSEVRIGRWSDFWSDLGKRSSVISTPFRRMNLNWKISGKEGKKRKWKEGTHFWRIIENVTFLSLHFTNFHQTLCRSGLVLSGSCIVSGIGGTVLGSKVADSAARRTWRERREKQTSRKKNVKRRILW